MKPDLFVRWHLGLGDAIICNGLVRTLAGDRESIRLTAKPHNIASVRAMFADLPAVSVAVGDDEQSNRLAAECKWIGWDILALGMFAPRFDRQRWAQSFYEQAGVPLADRWERFKVGDWGEQLAIVDQPYSIAHDGGSQNTAFISERYLRKVSCHVTDAVKGPLWQWRDWLQGAAEVHCIDSSVACLVDHLPENGQRLVLHKYARDSVLPDYRRKWKVLA